MSAIHTARPSGAARAFNKGMTSQKVTPRDRGRDKTLLAPLLPKLGERPRGCECYVLLFMVWDCRMGVLGCKMGVWGL